MNNFYSNLGILRRANLLAFGEMLVSAIQANQIHMVVISEDASLKTRKMLIDKCNFYHCPYVIYSKREDISKAIGKHNVVAIGIKDKTFAKKIDEQLKEVV